jgi:hypothetical protein
LNKNAWNSETNFVSYSTFNTKGKTMGYLEMFDMDFIDDVDPLDEWIQKNNAQVENINPISPNSVQNQLDQDYNGSDDE